MKRIVIPEVNMNRIEEQQEEDEEEELPDMNKFFIFVSVLFGLGIAVGIGQYFYGRK